MDAGGFPFVGGGSRFTKSPRESGRAREAHLPRAAVAGRGAAGAHSAHNAGAGALGPRPCVGFAGPSGPQNAAAPRRNPTAPRTPAPAHLRRPYGGCPAAQEGWGGPRGGGGVWQARRPHGAAGPPNKIASPGLKAPGSLFQDASRPAAAPPRRVFRQRQKGSANPQPRSAPPGKRW